MGSFWKEAIPVGRGPFQVALEEELCSESYSASILGTKLMLYYSANTLQVHGENQGVIQVN